jgi:hypothetical protein
MFISTEKFLSRGVTKSNTQRESRVITTFTSTMRWTVGGTRTKGIASTSLQNMCPVNPIKGTNELDTHADTCVLARNFTIAQYSGRECDVLPYSDDYEPVTGVPIVTGATAWTDQETGKTWILLIHEAIWMADTMPHSLINPNQLLAYGVDVEDNPSRGPLHITDAESDIQIPLRMVGTNILFNNHTPTQEELETCCRIKLSNQFEWQPASAHEVSTFASHLYRCSTVDLKMTMRLI